MHLTFHRAWHSITESVIDQEISDFVILSGPNGSGKTHLLEAIEQGAIQIRDLPQGPSPMIRMFRLAQLVAVAESSLPSAGFRDSWVNAYNILENARNQYMTAPHNLPRGSAQLDQLIRQQLTQSRQMSDVGIDKFIKEADKDLSELTEHDFHKYGPLVVGIRDPFQISVGEIFLTYQGRKDRNEFYQWQLATKGQSARTPISDKEFVDRYGPPPWELLNETLRLVGLPYKFNYPEGIEDNLQFQALLVDPTSGAQIRTDQLSSGEKTLLAIAMSLYMGSSLVEAIELPKALLLDESDASLHPSMIQSLLRVAEEVFVKRYGVKVILTTHSPSTVALAPEEALYLMRRSERPRLIAAGNRDRAMRALTVGISTLSVRIENRRQVFVESEYDEECYQELFRIVQGRLDPALSLEFIAAGKGGEGSVDGVKHLVSSLRTAGNNTVFGIVDRDSRSGAPEHITFASERYGLENFVFDPLILGAFLLREDYAKPDDLGLPPGTRHYEIQPSMAQTVIDRIVSEVSEDSDDSQGVAVGYFGDFKAEVPQWWLDIPGHKLEERLTSKWLPLRGYRRALKVEVIRKGYGDLVGFIPDALVTLFKQITSQ